MNMDMLVLIVLNLLIAKDLQWKSKLDYNKCIECYEAAKYIASQQACEIDMASTTVEVLHNFESVLEKEYTLEEKQIIRTNKILFCER